MLLANIYWFVDVGYGEVRQVDQLVNLSPTSFKVMHNEDACRITIIQLKKALINYKYAQERNKNSMFYLL